MNYEKTELDGPFIFPGDPVAETLDVFVDATTDRLVDEGAEVEFSASISDIGNVAIVGAKADLTAELRRDEPYVELDDGRIFSLKQLKLASVHAEQILECLSKMDTTKLLVRSDFYAADFYKDAVTDSARQAAFLSGLVALYGGLYLAAGKDMIGRAGSSGGSRYFVAAGFIYNGKIIKAADEAESLVSTFPEYQGKEINPENIFKISGEGITPAEIAVFGQLQKDLLQLLPAFDGEPITLGGTIKRNFHPNGDYRAQRRAFGAGRRLLSELFLDATGKDLLVVTGNKTKAKYLVTQDFKINGELVKASVVPEQTERKAVVPRPSRAKTQTIKALEPNKVVRIRQPIIENPLAPSQTQAHRLEQDQQHSLEAIIPFIKQRDPTEILRQPADLKLALIEAIDKPEVIANYSAAVALALRTGIMTEKHLKNPRYIGRDQTKQPLADFMNQHVQAYRGLDVASVSAILGLKPSVILAMESHVLASMIKGNPSMKVAKELKIKVDAELEAVLFPRAYTVANET